MDPFYAFVAFVVLVALETLASQAGLPAYFRIGLPIFIGRRPNPNRLKAGQLAPLLAERLQVSAGHNSIRPRVLSDSEIVLQERLFENRPGGRYLPVMHSLLRLDPTRGQVTLLGFLNLYVLAAVAYAVYRSLGDRSFIPVAILIVLLLMVSYVLQAGLNQRILSAASQDAPAV
jgi:hypothetical protein